MAKKKQIEVAKFGGVDELGSTKLDGHDHDVSSIETQSETKLEDDKGTGRPLVIRTYTFELNSKAFKVHVPTKQELFDGHVRGIETSLWRDGLTFAKDHEPRVLFNKKQTHYTIFVIAEPSRGNVITDNTRTLTELANG